MSKPIKWLKESKEEKLNDNGFGTDFLVMTPKAQQQK
jgi:hypothetical protein